MILRVVFRRAAKNEFEDAALRYDEQRSGLGEEFIHDIDQAVARRFAFSVYFRVRTDALIVLAVFHGRRDPRIWRRRA